MIVSCASGGEITLASSGATVPVLGATIGIGPARVAGLGSPWQPGRDQAAKGVIGGLVDLMAVAVVDRLGVEHLIAEHHQEALPDGEHVGGGGEGGDLEGEIFPLPPVLALVRETNGPGCDRLQTGVAVEQLADAPADHDAQAHGHMLEA